MAGITLSVLRCPDSVVPEQRRATGGEMSLGRGADCDWQLADPDRVLSKKHCVVEFFGGGWQLRDTSTNGTFVNHSAQPVGRDQVRPLLDGDRLRLGAYEIEVRIEEEAQAGAGWGAAPPFATAPGGSPFGGAPPSADPFGAPPPSPGFGNAPLPGFGAPPPAQAGGGLLPDDFDPFADNAAPMPDHAPSTAEAFMVPPSLPAGKAVIPDDWDLELNQASAPPPQPAPRLAPMPPPAAPPPFATPVADPFAPQPPPSRGFAPPPPPPQPIPMDLPDPFAEQGDPSLRPQPVPVAVVAPAMPPMAPPAPATAVPPAPAGASGSAATGVSGSAATGVSGSAATGLHAFLDGAGLPAAMATRAGADPEATLRAAGAVLRAAVAGIRALLIARADVKREFRIEQTMLRAANNNPLKFAATEEQALAALLDPRTPALPAMQETVDDLTAHQVAALAATQAAARALLARLAPGPIEAEDPGGGLLPGAKEKRLWEAYKRRHAQLEEQFEDDFDSAFGKAFARAYEQATGRKD